MRAKACSRRARTRRCSALWDSSPDYHPHPERPRIAPRGDWAHLRQLDRGGRPPERLRIATNSYTGLPAQAGRNSRLTGWPRIAMLSSSAPSSPHQRGARRSRRPRIAAMPSGQAGKGAARDGRPLGAQPRDRVPATSRGGRPESVGRTEGGNDVPLDPAQARNALQVADAGYLGCSHGVG